MHNTLNDLRFALRQLRRSPGFALTAVLTLALGIGANTAIFSLLDQALLRSLPVQNPRQLVLLEGTGDAWEGHTSSYGSDRDGSLSFSYPMYKDLRDHDSAFAGLIGSASATIGFAHAGSSQLVDGELVTGNYFSVLGVQPALGRLLTPNDDTQKDANPVGVLSFDFWKNLGADPTLVGSTASINGQPYQIVGVAAPGFHSAVFGQTPALFVPMSMLGQILPGKDKRLIDHTDRWMNVMGRLKPGESIQQAQAASAPLWHALRAEELQALGVKSRRFTDGFLTNSHLLLEPGSRGFSYERENYATPLLVVMAMALLVLLIACVNVASLLLVRSAGRMREFSMRYALGAKTTRIVQQLLLEGLLIGAGGGAAGLLFAPLAIRVLVHHLNGDEIDGAFTASFDGRLLLFNFAIALAVSLFFSFAPGLQLRKPDLTLSLRQQSGTGTGVLLSFRRAVVCLQIGLSVLLLVGAGLFIRTMQNLRHVDVGFTTAHLITFGINPKLAGYTPAAVPQLQQRVIDSMATLPGVQSVAATEDPELAGSDQGGGVTVAGYTPPPDEELDVQRSFINPAYFSTMQVPLLAGRLFTQDDAAGHPLVSIVNQSFAEHFCGNAANCIGRMMSNGGTGRSKLDTEIVGVVRDAKHQGVREGVEPTCFRPLKQAADPARLFLYIRTFFDPAQALSMVRRSMQQLDPKLALVALRTMDQQIDDDLSNERLVSLLSVSFGVLATLLAGIGLYGVLAYSTAQRTREIGIRIALGSPRLTIARLVLSDVLRLAALGVASAVPVAFVVTRLLRSQLYGVSPADPLTLGGAILLIAAVAVLAALIPAQRAATVNPTEALRAE